MALILNVIPSAYTVQDVEICCADRADSVMVSALHRHAGGPVFYPRTGQN